MTTTTPTLANEIANVEALSLRYDDIPTVTYDASAGNQHNQHVLDFKVALRRHIQLKAATLPFTALSRTAQRIADGARLKRHSYARFNQSFGLDYNPADILPLSEDEKRMDSLIRPCKTGR